MADEQPQVTSQGSGLPEEENSENNHVRYVKVLSRAGTLTEGEEPETEQDEENEMARFISEGFCQDLLGI